MPGPGWFPVSPSLCSRPNPARSTGDSTLPVSERVQDLLAVMTPGRKVLQLFMIPAKFHRHRKISTGTGCLISGERAGGRARCQPTITAIHQRRKRNLAGYPDQCHATLFCQQNRRHSIIPFDEGDCMDSSPGCNRLSSGDCARRFLGYGAHAAGRRPSPGTRQRESVRFPR